MIELVICFQEYLKINIYKIVPILFIGVMLQLTSFVLKKIGRKSYKNGSRKTRVYNWLMSFEIAFIFVMTIYGRSVGMGDGFKLQLFVSYVEAFGQGNTEMQLQIIMNILMFIPWGLLLPLSFERFKRNKTVILTTAIISISIEMLQGVTTIGTFDVDDIFGNVLGAEIGFACFAVGTWLKNNDKKCTKG